MLASSCRTLYLVGRAVPCKRKLRKTLIKFIKSCQGIIIYLDALMADKEEVDVSRMCDFGVDHKSWRNVAVLIGHLVLGVREESSVVTLLHDQESDLGVVVGIHSLDSSVNSRQLHTENLKIIKIQINTF